MDFLEADEERRCANPELAVVLFVLAIIAGSACGVLAYVWRKACP